MRTKLLADRAAGNDSAFQKFLDERKEQDGEKKNGFFSNMGKFVAKRWKELVRDCRLFVGGKMVSVGHGKRAVAHICGFFLLDSDP